jgi:hypothetical protein
MKQIFELSWSEAKRLEQKNTWFYYSFAV